MKASKIFLIAVFGLTSALLTSCGGGTTSTTADSKMGDMVSLKTCMIEYKLTIDLPEIKSTSIITAWIDNTSDNQAVFTDMEVEARGRKEVEKSLMILKDGWNYEINLTNKTGFKSKDDEMDDKPVNIINAEDDATFRQMIESEGGKIVGNEKVLGRDCIVVEMNIEDETDEPMLIKAWYYKGIILKTTNALTTMEATRLEENIKIPSSKFEIPDDIKIHELPSYK